MFLPKTPIFFSPIQSVPAHAYPPRPARQSRWDFPSPRPPPALPSSPPTTIPPSPPLSPPLHSPTPSYGAPRYPLLPTLMAATAGFSRARRPRGVPVVATDLLSAGVGNGSSGAGGVGSSGNDGAGLLAPDLLVHFWRPAHESRSPT
jgi:hypothetical protein